MTGEPQWAKVAGGPLRGHEMLHDPGAKWQEAMLDGSFDAFIYNAIEQAGGLRDADVWDVGAHFGYHTLSFAVLVGPKGRVIAFEPNPANLARLAQHLEHAPELRPRVEVMPVALSDTDGAEVFMFSRSVESGMSSGSHLERAMVPSPAEQYASFERTAVEVRTADALWRSGRVPPPRVIKIDVEGAESLILDGAFHLLRAVRPLLFLEVHNITQMFLVQRQLIEAGYRTEILDAEHASVSRCFVLAKVPES